jgi:nicotinate-nucleotide adenylyltransferase
MKPAKTIALFGGSFDPPHLGHVAGITTVLNSGLVDEVWIVPAGANKDKPLIASSKQRKAMVKLMLKDAFAKDRRVRLEACQLNYPDKVSTAIDLLKMLEKKRKGCKFYFVIGTDLVKDIPRWHRAKELIKRKPFLLEHRPGFPFRRKLPAYVRELPEDNNMGISISSTQIRKKIKSGQSIEEDVPESVAGYIRDFRLY